MTWLDSSIAGYQDSSGRGGASASAKDCQSAREPQKLLPATHNFPLSTFPRGGDPLWVGSALCLADVAISRPCRRLHG